MELIQTLGIGFATALSVQNLLLCFVGVLLGTLVGVLPGIGPVATISMLLPITFVMPPVAALIMMAGIYYGTQYGGSTTAILINMPGEASSIVTALDGHQMARQGRAGAALATAALASFFAGTFATVLVAMLAPPLTELALKVGSPEYFALMVLGLVASISLAQGSVLKALSMLVLGVLLGTIGQDKETGAERFTFGIPDLADGLEFVAIAMGLFGLCEILRNLEDDQSRSVVVQRVGGLMLSREEFARAAMPALRGTLLGSVLGVLPGGGAILASFAAYSLEKRISHRPETFGKGAIEGVASPEAANNAAAQTSFIPMLTLGIPASPVMALMIGAMVVQGITPGPTVMLQKPELFWGLIASMWIGNAMLLVLNLPLVGIWVRLLTVPYHLLYPAIIGFCCIGVLSISNNPFQVYTLIAFGLGGYLLMRLDFEPAPLLLGFVIGPMLEENFRRSMVLSGGDPMIFAERPVTAMLLAVAGAALVIASLPAIRRKRQETFNE
ncbi:MAG: tripartite tricarboxylate transporter permease [Comamonadaceae bacterium]|nr:MAG: tripartite tricarboxylate transporter permease [Comamonadaceae bacterium]